MAPLVLEADVPVIPLTGKMQWLKDDSRSLLPEQAAASPAWQPLPGDPGFGFTPAAIWLRMEIVQAAPGTPWRLEVNNAILEDVRFYVRDAAGNWSEQRAGRAVSHREWPFDSRSPVFRVDVPAGSYIALVRLASRNSMSTGIRLWQTEALYAWSRNEAMLWGGYFGMYALVILFQFLFWNWTRETLSGWYVPYAGVNFLGVLLTVGYLQNALDLGNELAMNLMGLSICAALGFGCWFTSVLLELRRAAPRFNRWWLATGLTVSVVSCVLVLTGRYSIGVMINQAAAIALILSVAAMALVLLRRGHTSVRYFLIAFGIFYLGIVIRYLRNLGVLEPSLLTDYSVQLGSILHMIVMCLLLIYRYNTLKHALRIEQKARQEQRDFVAMVSHEYRTPLAIINTSVQQLMANQDAPQEKFLKRCGNIRGAVQRMTDLLDKYLSSERLEEAHTPLQMAQYDPARLLEDVVSDWPEERIRLTLDNLPRQVRCDRQLLEVALRNLVVNADRHAWPESVIELKGEGDDRGGLRVSVCNQGDEIAPDERLRLFQKYFRGRASRGKAGAGLGLFLVKRIVELHGGEVSVDSVVGKTRFDIFLPGVAVS